MEIVAVATASPPDNFSAIHSGDYLVNKKQQGSGHFPLIHQTVVENGQEVRPNQPPVSNGDVTSDLPRSEWMKCIKSFLSSSVGVLSLKTALVFIVWYVFSFASIFLSKFIIDHLSVDLLRFSVIQMLVAALMGLVNMRYPCYMYQPITSMASKKESYIKSTSFYKVMFFVGSMRFLVVYLGLVSLKYIAVSFTETIKSSAPLFTVVISRVILKEKNGVFVQLSLIPIMLGLVLCSAYELSFTWIGFYAALGTNVSECLQFVTSKLSFCHDHYRLNPAEFQLYTCTAAVAADFFLSLFLSESGVHFSIFAFALMFINGLLYHFQTMMAWVLMEFLSPVTHSVCNTVKCALAVWISIPLFGNHVTMLSGVGTCVVIFGVLLYNKARNFEHDLAIVSISGISDLSSVNEALDGKDYRDSCITIEKHAGDPD